MLENHQKESPLVSVIMPVYNGEQFLSESIESVLNQQLTNFELIIVNDGSSDGTQEIIGSFIDSRIVLINFGKNLGISNALNAGIARARGQFIARMDSDDICLPSRFQ